MEHELIAYYEKSLSDSEKKEVERWINAHPSHLKTFEDIVFLWKNSKQNSVFRLYDKNKAWEKIQSEINLSHFEPSQKTKALSSIWWQLGAAAAILAFIILLPLYFNKSKKHEQFTASESQKRITLKDKSNIILFPKTTLTLDPDFYKKTRTVTLKGNAFFDISKNPDKPFIVHSNDLIVEVLGTSFTIKQGSEFNTVFVHKGKVRAIHNGQSITATAKQKIIKDNKTQSLYLENMKADIEAILQSQTLKVKDIRIDSLSHILESLYNIEIKMSPNIKEKKITSTYFLGTETLSKLWKILL
ncbi:MAG: FecR domain-containing protein [Sphingobacteriales bacterium]|nr:FecR domain-containing protein [Sphingobacteriales bacterium]